MMTTTTRRRRREVDCLEKEKAREDLAGPGFSTARLRCSCLTTPLSCPFGVLCSCMTPALRSTVVLLFMACSADWRATFSFRVHFLSLFERLKMEWNGPRV